MNFLNKRRVRVLSLVMALVFFGSTFGAYAQEAMYPQTYTATPQPANPLLDLTNMIGAHPEVTLLNANLSTVESSLKQINTTAIPLYRQIAPSNMEAMSIAERIKAIMGNTKNLLGMGLNSYKGQVSEWNAAHGITPDTSFEAEMSVGLNELGVQSAKLPMGGTGNAIVAKLKVIIEALKNRLTIIVNAIRAKIASIAQKVGLMKKTDESKKGVEKEQEGVMRSVEEPGIQQADTFSAKLSKGVAEGTQNAKASLKSSFSVTNLAVTTTVAVGTNLAMQMIRGEKPSFGKAVKLVTSLEFAGSVAGSALGAAGGQFAASMVRSFLPGPIGCLVGAVLPVMAGSLAGQMGSSLAGDLKSRQFSISKAWKSVDKVDLLGSSIGSTIGMALGAPIPIIGPIIGGIVGGMLGGKVAKLIQGFFKTGKLNIINRNTNLPDTSGSTIQTGGISIGNGGNIGLGTNYGGQLPGGMTPTGDTAKVSGDVRAAESKYYETYLQYNRLVDAGKYDEAKKVYTDLKVYSDQYNALKNQAK